MAERRMFSKLVIDSDAFLDMPLSTQALYFHLSMRADDDGFLNNSKKIMKMIGANQNDYDVLVAKSFIIQFPDGICVIKHWRLHNYIQKDRYHPTPYSDDKNMLENTENGYSVSNLYTECVQDVSKMDTEVRLGKVSIGKSKSKEEHEEPQEYFPDDELNKAFLGYIAFRKDIKAKMTDRAITLSMNQLNKLSGGDNDKAIKILDQSVMNGWKGLYDLKDVKGAKRQEDRYAEVDDWLKGAQDGEK